MGGQIGLQSELESRKYVLFEVTLRVASSIEPPINELSHDLLKDLRVLVVDDNETNRTILKAQLEAWRMRPELADGAAMALDMLRSAALKGRPFDLAALDMQMPDVDGLELAAGSPVILCSRHADDHALLESAARSGDHAIRGVRQWLSKPVRSSELFDR